MKIPLDTLLYLIKNITFKEWVIIFIVGMVGLISAFLILEKYTTSRPEFCLSCHYYQSTSDFQTKSKVHPSVNCSECHAKHSEFIPKGYSADRERTNANCLRCHTEMTQKKDGAKFKFNEKSIIVNHSLHTDKLKIQCSVCHANIYHDKVTPQTNRPRMEFCQKCHKPETSCYQCHPRGTLTPPLTKNIKRTDCEQCHSGFAARKSMVYGLNFSHVGHFASGVECENCHINERKHGEILPDLAGCMSCHHNKVRAKCEICHGEKGGKEQMAEENCNYCHKDFEEKTRQIYGITFSHIPHIKNKVQCVQCHANKPKHGNIRKTRAECLACHHALTSPQCGVCHLNEAEMRKGSIKGLPSSSADVMFKKVGCKDCHRDIEKGFDRQKTRSVCSTCHSKDYIDFMNEWQTQYSDTVKKCESTLADILNLTAEKPAFEKELSEAKAIVEALKKDKSKGVHNTEYIDILKKRLDNIRHAIKNRK